MTTPADLAKARAALTKMGGEHVGRHIFLCALSDKQACCSREQGERSWKYLTRRLKELKVVGRTVQRTKADCLQVCEAGRSRSYGPTRSGIIRAMKRRSNRSFNDT